MEHSTNQMYYRLRRGNQVHTEKKHDRHTTWLVCGLQRLTHRLIKETTFTMENMCTRCFLGVSKRELDKLRVEIMMEKLKPLIFKQLYKKVIAELDRIVVDDQDPMNRV